METKSRKMKFTDLKDMLNQTGEVYGDRPAYIFKTEEKGKVSVKLLETQDKWFGVTYKEDKPVVVESFAKLIADGVYRKDLFSDLQA